MIEISKYSKAIFIFLFFNLFVVQYLFAQDYRLIEGDVFIGSGPIIGEEDAGTLIIGYEPRINVSDKISLSVRAEIAVTQEENMFETYISSFSSLQLFGDYYFINKRNRRGFVGIGGGINNPPGRSNSFGFSQRIGFELENLRVSITHNHMPFLKNVPKYIGFTFGINIGGKSRQVDK